MLHSVFSCVLSEMASDPFVGKEIGYKHAYCAWNTVYKLTFAGFGVLAALM